MNRGVIKVAAALGAADSISVALASVADSLFTAVSFGNSLGLNYFKRNTF